MTEDAGTLWVVILEWEGRKPPSSFYRHVRRLLDVGKRNGRPETSARAHWIQESAFVLGNEFFARLVAGLAEAKGCSRYLLMGEGRIATLSDRDRKAVDLLIRRWERPGPRRWRDEAEQRESLERDVSDAIQIMMPADELVRRVL